MKSYPLLLVSSLLALTAGCTTTGTNVSRAPVKEEVHFTIAHLDASQVDVAPRLVKIVRPQLAATQPGGGSDGYAIVAFIVDAEGLPREVQWAEASDAHFADLATAAIAESRYNPAQVGGKAVATTMAQRWDFRGKDLSISVLPPYNPRSNLSPDMKPTNYYEQGVNPRTPTYQPGGPLP